MPEWLSRDVVIVGAGPAGSATAALLAGRASVLVLDRKLDGTGKACAGGILLRALRHLPKGVDVPWQDAGISSFTLSHVGERGFRRDTKSPLMGTVLRSEFDAALLDCAKRAGAEVQTGQEVLHVERRDDGVAVSASGIRVRAKVLIGADGADGIIARQCGLVRRLDLDPALVLHVSPRDMDPFRHWAAMDWDSPAGGYSWAFPKTDHLSVGAVGHDADGATLRQCALNHLIRHIGQDHQVLSESVACVPLATSDLDRARGRVLLVGDAATLVDPFTREGISWALWSAHLAARAVLGFLAGAADLQAYEDLLEDQLLPELRAAAGIARWFYSDADKAQRWLAERRFVWSRFCGLLNGRVSHRRLYRMLPSAVRSLPTDTV